MILQQPREPGLRFKPFDLGVSARWLQEQRRKSSGRIGLNSRELALAERIKRLRTVPGVGPITALGWALEMGDVSRFRSIRQAISYWGGLRR